jgi:hypothetical protein
MVTLGEWCLYAGIASLARVPYMLALLHWWVGLRWYCYIGEWAYVGIATLASGPMLVLLHWWVGLCWYCFNGECSLYVGIAILVSGPYMLALLHWWVGLCLYCYSGKWLLVLFWTLLSVPRCWYCYTEVLYTGECSYLLALLYWWSVSIILVLLHWWVFPTCWHCYTGELCLYAGIASLGECSLHVDIATLVMSFILVLLYWWGPLYWYCYTGDWYLYVGIAILVSSYICCYPQWWVIPVYWNSYICKISVHVGLKIATLESRIPIKFKFSPITAQICPFSSLRKEIYICHKGSYLGLI